MQALFAATTLALVAGGVSAADRVDLQKLNVGQLKKQNAASSIATMAHERHAQLLGMDSESRLVLKARHADYGVRNTRYQQTYRGVPVFGEQVIVSEDGSGEVRAQFGQKVEGLASEIGSVQGKLGSAQALAIGKRAGVGNRTVIENQKSEKVIFIDDNGRAHLAYFVSYFADLSKGGAPTRPTVIVDADSGRVLKKWDGPDPRPDRHRPRRQPEDRPVRVRQRRRARLQRRGAERQHVHDEQHQRQDGQPQPRHHRDDGVRVHLPAQHREGHQRRLFAAE